MEKHFLPADILLPKKNFEEWSVIACDQYTSQPEYWRAVEDTVGNKPSALNIIFPEVYLGNNDDEKIADINKNMADYINGDVFNTYNDAVIYTVRTLKNGNVRRGIVGLIDLEEYSYEKNAKTSIRATEETVIERIPPRVKIRKDATLELPHIMLLIDDKDATVIEPLEKKVNNFQKLYDFSLMQNSGSIKGYKLDEASVCSLQAALEKLKQDSEDGLLFAVGDGNHSLATAKECYNNGFGPRYALVEVVNIHDTSLEFEPIYRCLFGADGDKIIADFMDYCSNNGRKGEAHKYTVLFGSKRRVITVSSDYKLPVAALQEFLDSYLKQNEEIKIDYIHGIENVEALCTQENTVGFIFDGMEKDQLFPAVSANGSLPRKTFSMGTADDKRFYLEAKRI